MNRPPTPASGEASQQLPPTRPNFLIVFLTMATIGCIHHATWLFTDVFVISHYQNEKERTMIILIHVCYYLELRIVKTI